METSHAVKPANIRVINRRSIGPVSVHTPEQLLISTLLYGGAGKLFSY